MVVTTKRSAASEAADRSCHPTGKKGGVQTMSPLELTAVLVVLLAIFKVFFK